jgi:hypothetical protein
MGKLDSIMMPATTHPQPGLPPARPTRWVRRVVALVLGTALVYLVLINLMLNCGLLPSVISGHPDKVLVTWKSAWSPWPGRAYVRGFYLRKQQEHVQWELAIDEAVTRVNLFALLSRRFETRWVQAQGVVLRLRPRVAAGADYAEITAPFPPIQGLPSAALDEHYVDDSDNSPWSVRLEGVDVTGVREAWIGAYRGIMDLTVHGRFWILPRQFLQVGPATVAFSRGKITQGSTPVATSLSGHGTCAFNVEKPGDVAGADVLRALDAALSATGELKSLEPLNYHLRSPVHPELEGGNAWLSVNVGSQHGALTEGSEITVAGGPLAITPDGESLPSQLLPYRLRGSWSAHGLVKKDENRLASALDITLSAVRLDDEQTTLVKSSALKVTLGCHDLVLGTKPVDGVFAAELVETEPFSLRPVNGYIAGHKFRIDSGRTTLQAQFRLGPGSPAQGGSLVLRTGHVQTTWGLARLSGTAVIEVDLARLRLARESADFSGSSIALTDVTIATARAHPRGWNGRMSLESGSLVLTPSVSAKAEIAGLCSDARPFLALFGDQIGLPRWATSLLEAKHLHVGGKVNLVGSSLNLRGLSANGENLRISGALDLSQADVRGLFLLKVHGFGLGLKLTKSHVESKLFGQDDWFKHQQLSFVQ